MLFLYSCVVGYKIETGAHTIDLINTDGSMPTTWLPWSSVWLSTSLYGLCGGSK